MMESKISEEIIFIQFIIEDNSSPTLQKIKMCSMVTLKTY